MEAFLVTAGIEGRCCLTSVGAGGLFRRVPINWTAGLLQRGQVTAGYGLWGRNGQGRL